jgi:mannitol-1-phosphate/altronate dehydrogenase
LEPGDWGICAYSLNNKKLIDALISQDNLYNVVEIGSDTKIVSLTVTEAEYSISQLTNSLDISVDDVKNDLQGGASRTVYGILKGAILDGRPAWGKVGAIFTEEVEK